MRAFVKTMMMLLIVLFSSNTLSAQEPAMTMSIGGDVKKPRLWSAEQLKAQFADQIKEVKFTDPSWQKKTGKGIPLLSLIKAAEPRLEKTTKFHKDQMHYDMSFLVILEARDNFRVYFSLAELMPQLGSSDIYLVWDKEGEPLSGKEGPFRLATMNTKMPDREIYGISSISIVDGDKLADQLKAK
jgi:hypothetical protein